MGASMSDVCLFPSKIWCSSVPNLWETGVTMSPPEISVHGKYVESTSSRRGPEPKVYYRLEPRLSLKPRLRHFTYIGVKSAKIYQMINNSTAYCSISLKFGTKFDHVTSDIQLTTNVQGKSRGQRSRSLCDVTPGKCAKSWITSPQIARFCSNLVQSLIA